MGQRWPLVKTDIATAASRNPSDADADDERAEEPLELIATSGLYASASGTIDRSMLKPLVNGGPAVAALCP